jgi:phosphoribosylformylglycinamidine cyclo-ligase
MSESKYRKLGVDARKKGIGAFKDIVSGLYRHAFCDIHSMKELPGYGYVHHVDGAGSKPVQNYLNWRETGNIEAFSGIAQDVLSMDICDAFCVGVPTSSSFVDYIAINRFRVPRQEVVDILVRDWKKLFDMLRGHDINIKLAGGETADLPDQLRTLDVSGTIHAIYKLDKVITGEKIAPGDSIIGIPSGGQASYEDKPAGPIMSNGLTLARHCLMRPEFALKYPEITEPGKEYTGPFAPADKAPGIEGTVGEELTRPTRIFAPVFKGVIETFGDAVHGIVFNTGGGHTKCLRVGDGIFYVKDGLDNPPAIFKLIQKHGEVPWREMYIDFNMGMGAEVFVDSAISSEVPRFIQEKFGIDASRIGECKRAKNHNRVCLETPYGNFYYDKK